MIGGKARSSLFYGWVIVAAGTATVALNSSIVNSFGVFFKPLAADFGWSRATTSTVQSIFLIFNGVSAVGMGWLADRFGPSKILAVCAVMMASGLALSSQINALWQIYFTHGIMTGIGSGGCSTIALSTTARWFVKRRGLAVGIVSSGNGLGVLTIAPVVALLIGAFGWSGTYLLIGLGAFAILVGSALLLRSSPEAAGLRPYGSKATQAETKPAYLGKTQDISFRTPIPLAIALRTKTLWLMVGIFSMFTFCNQMVTVHLVNLATDRGIAPFIAATLISAVGAAGGAGRLLMGFASDRIGS